MYITIRKFSTDSFDSCNSYLQKAGLHESKLLFVSRVEFVPFKHSNGSAHVSRFSVACEAGGRRGAVAKTAELRGV